MSGKATSNIRIEVAQSPSSDKDEFVRDALHEFNVAQIGKDHHYSIFVFNPNSAIRGGSFMWKVDTEKGSYAI